jgi:hypothetical protein
MDIEERAQPTSVRSKDLGYEAAWDIWGRVIQAEGMAGAKAA